MKKDWLYVDDTSSMKKDWLCRCTSSMKKGWLCRDSYDEKNPEIALVMMTQR